MKAFPIWLCIGILLVGISGVAQSAENTNAEILLQKIKADKKLLVASNMDLTDEEGKKFWPLYSEYQKELEHINHSLGKAIQEYAEAYNKGPLSNDEATKLATTESDLLTLKKKWESEQDGTKSKVELEARIQPIGPVLELLAGWGYGASVLLDGGWRPLAGFDLPGHQRAAIGRVSQSFVRRVLWPRPRYVNLVLCRSST